MQLQNTINTINIEEIGTFISEHILLLTIIVAVLLIACVAGLKQKSIWCDFSNAIKYSISDKIPLFIGITLGIVVTAILRAIFN